MKLKTTYTTPASQTLEVKTKSALLLGSDQFFFSNLDGGDLDGTRGDYTGDYESKWF